MAGKTGETEATGALLFTPLPFLPAHTPLLWLLESAGQEQIKPVAEVVTEMLVCQAQYDKGAGSKKGLIYMR